MAGIAPDAGLHKRRVWSPPQPLDVVVRFENAQGCTSHRSPQIRVRTADVGGISYRESAQSDRIANRLGGIMRYGEGPHGKRTKADFSTRFELGGREQL